jgi:hypothetical protein
MYKKTYEAPAVPTANIKVKIYCIDFNNGEKYIGYTTTTLKKRLSNHKSIHNDILSITEIDEIIIPNDDQISKILIETYWIEQFKQWGFILRNKNKGGGGSIAGTISDETRKKQSEKKLNKPLSKEHINKISLSHLTRDKNSYISGMKNKKHSEVSKNKISQKLQKENHYNYGKIANNCIEIIQLDKNKIKIKEWSSITEASNNLKLCRTDIIKVLNYKRKTCGGFIWEYKNVC